MNKQKSKCEDLEEEFVEANGYPTETPQKCQKIIKGVADLIEYEILDSLYDKDQVMCADGFGTKSLRECGSHFGECFADIIRPVSCINDPDSFANSIGECLN